MECFIFMWNAVFYLSHSFLKEAVRINLFSKEGLQIAPRESVFSFSFEEMYVCEGPDRDSPVIKEFYQELDVRHETRMAGFGSANATSVPSPAYS